MTTIEFFRRLHVLVVAMFGDDLYGQINIHIAPGGKIGSVELTKVVKNPE